MADAPTGTERSARFAAENFFRHKQRQHAGSRARILAPGAVATFTGPRQPGGYQFQITGTPNAIEWTADLQAWQLLNTGAANGSGALNLTDPAAASAARRLYRAVR